MSILLLTPPRRKRPIPLISLDGGGTKSRPRRRRDPYIIQASVFLGNRSPELPYTNDDDDDDDDDDDSLSCGSQSSALHVPYENMSEIASPAAVLTCHHTPSAVQARPSTRARAWSWSSANKAQLKFHGVLTSLRSHLSSRLFRRHREQESSAIASASLPQPWTHTLWRHTVVNDDAGVVESHSGGDSVRECDGSTIIWGKKYEDDAHSTNGNERRYKEEGTKVAHVRRGVVEAIDDKNIFIANIFATILDLPQFLGPSGLAVLRASCSQCVNLLPTPKTLAKQSQVPGPAPWSIARIIFLSKYIMIDRKEMDKVNLKERQNRQEYVRFQNRLDLDRIFNFIHQDRGQLSIPSEEWDAYESTPKQFWPPICALIAKRGITTPMRLVEWLLEQNADINEMVTVPMDYLSIVRSSHKITITPLVLATSSGDVDLVKKLINVGADIRAKLTKSSSSLRLNLRPKTVEYPTCVEVCKNVAWYTGDEDMFHFWDRFSEDPELGSDDDDDEEKEKKGGEI